MGLYPIDCPQCGTPFMWFSGNLPDQRCDECRKGTKMSEAKKIVLTPLAITDLSISYARKMDENKIVHYRISDILSLTDPNGQNPFGRVVEYIREQEGNVEVSLNDTQQVELQKMSKNGMVVSDVSNEVFKMTSGKTKKDLLKIKANGLIHQYEYYFSNLDRYKDLVAHHINNVIFQVNRFIQFLKGNPYGFGLQDVKGVPVGRAVRGFLPKTFEYINDRRCLRMISLVRYIGVTYKESQEKEALASLAKDLDLLSSLGLIQGHLAAPSTLFLADTLGSGDRMKAAFCFPLINDQKACQLLNRNPLDMPRMFLSLFGVTGEMSEGGLPPYLNGIDPKDEYKVEVIDILPGIHDEQRRAVIENYMQTRDHVNAVAKAQKEAMANSEIEVQSTNIVDTEDPLKPTRKLKIDVNIKKKE